MKTLLKRPDLIIVQTTRKELGQLGWNECAPLTGKFACEVWTKGNLQILHNAKTHTGFATRK